MIVIGERADRCGCEITNDVRTSLYSQLQVARAEIDSVFPDHIVSSSALQEWPSIAESVGVDDNR